MYFFENYVMWVFQILAWKNDLNARRRRRRTFTTCRPYGYANGKNSTTLQQWLKSCPTLPSVPRSNGKWLKISYETVRKESERGREEGGERRVRGRTARASVRALARSPSFTAPARPTSASRCPGFVRAPGYSSQELGGDSKAVGLKSCGSIDSGYSDSFVGSWPT